MAVVSMWPMMNLPISLSAYHAEPSRQSKDAFTLNDSRLTRERGWDLQR
jgi:hypothetical protein